MPGDWFLAYTVLVHAMMFFIPYLGAVLMPSKRALTVYAAIGSLILLALWLDHAVRGREDQPVTAVFGVVLGVLFTGGFALGALTRCGTLFLEARTFSRRPTFAALICGLAIAVVPSWLFWSSLLKVGG
jgi:hypothetical protein